MTDLEMFRIAPFILIGIVFALIALACVLMAAWVVFEWALGLLGGLVEAFGAIIGLGLAALALYGLVCII